MARAVKINALVDALRRYDPEVLHDLQAQYPEHQDLLTPGQFLGETESNALVLADLATRALSTIRKRIDANLAWLRRRLNRAKRLQLIGNIVSTTTSVGLISAVLVKSETAAIATAVINFFSSTSLLVTQHLEAPLFGKQDAPHALFDRLVHTAVESETVEQKLTLEMNAAKGSERLLSLVQEANAIVANVRSIEVVIGTPIP